MERSIRDLTKYLPNLESVSVVPVGLSKYRDGLYPLEPFIKEDACQVIDTIEAWQKKIYGEYGLHFIHASDEWYIMAEREMPEEERYDGYLQLENGVGMLRLLCNEFEEALCHEKSRHGTTVSSTKKREVSIATGKLAYPYLRKMADQVQEVFPEYEISVYPITNHFFGERITVSGFLTGQDIMAQLMDKKLGEKLLLPQNVLRSGEDVFLDDIHLPELEKTLQVPIDIVKSSGYDLLNSILGN